MSVPAIWRFLIVASVIAAQAPGTILGRWVGDSRCVGAQGSCHDEHVVYRIDSTGAKTAVLHGSRIAGADTVDMGDLMCDRTQTAVTCTIPVGTWRFSLKGDQLEGTLTRTDRSLARQVTARRPPSR